MDKITMSRILASLMIPALATPAMAQCGIDERGYFTASDATNGHRMYASTVSLDGDWAAVGASFTSEGGFFGVGAVYMYHSSAGTGTEAQRLTASDGQENDYFGTSVSVRGDQLIVGTYRSGTVSSITGAAYVFRLESSAWLEEQKLLALNPTAGSSFVYSVAIDGEWAVVGASHALVDGVGVGSAFVFHRTESGWAQTQELQPSDGAADDFFGRSVAISGDRILVGADGHDILGSQVGAAYVFHLVGGAWIQESKLLPQTLIGGAAFGLSVGLSPNSELAIVGAIGESDHGPQTGAAYVFRRDSSIWIPEARLTADDGAANDHFSVSVDISDGRALIGASGVDDYGKYSGAAYVYRPFGPSWVQESKLVASDASDSDFFGTAVAIDGTVCLVGAPLARYSLALLRGKAYVFETREPCPGDADGSGVVDFGDITAVIAAWLTDVSPCLASYGDANADMVVNFDDINAVLASWLHTCPQGPKSELLSSRAFLTSDWGSESIHGAQQ